VQVVLASGADIEAINKDGETALHTAALYSAKGATKVLLDKGASVHATDKREKTPLHWASTGEIVALLLDSGADIESRDVDGDTPLHICVASAVSETSAVTELVRRGAIVSALDDGQQTPLHRAYDSVDSVIIKVLLDSGAGIEARDNTGKTPLHCAAEGSTVAVTALLQRGAAVSALDNDQHTPLHYAKTSDTIAALVNAGANMKARDCDGDTPLHCACTLGNNAVTVLSAFIRAEAELNTMNNKGDTPLHAAVSCNTVSSIEVVELLVASGARLDIRNKAGKTAYDVACALGHDSKLLNLIQPDAAQSRQELLHAVHSADATELQTLLNFGIETAATDIDGQPLIQFICSITGDEKAECLQVLLAGGADVETTDKYGRTALHAAAACDVKAAVRLLLANGASVHATDCSERTPLHEAKSSEVVTLLLDSGADIEARDVDGSTPLCDAAFMSSPVTLKALLHRGATVSARDSKQLTPLHYAETSENTAELLRYGADLEAHDSTVLCL
jgi:ankyrin repeat protein